MTVETGTKTSIAANAPAAAPPRLRMPLARRLIVINLALIAALAVLGIALTWGVRGMRRAVSSAADEYKELRLVEEAMVHCSVAKSQLTPPASNLDVALREMRDAADKLRDFRVVENGEVAGEDELLQAERGAVSQAEAAISNVLQKITLAQSSGVTFQNIEDIDAAVMRLSELASKTNITGARAAAAERTVTALIIVAALAGLIVLGSMLASAVSYWSVMNPLKRLHRGVRRLATGQFNERLEESGSREFSELAAEFNRMAAELHNLYTDLENKVQSKSQELVRSERLASVGFLAAGVAHEINNPLNIMSGYAEMAQGWLDGAARNRNVAEVQEALEIIRQEAFRCKEITGKLLSLATTGDSERGEVSLPRLINEVAQMLRGLRKYRDRTITVEAQAGAGQPVNVSAAEIKQVLLNLLVNALDAAPETGGEVHVVCHGAGQWVEITVLDNGVGMTPEVLERAFEPFFTTRRQGAHQGNRGIGLGLSISHAIITSHGGRIRAESEGLGRGSRFIIELPIARQATSETSSTHGHALNNNNSSNADNVRVSRRDDNSARPTDAAGNAVSAAAPGNPSGNRAPAGGAAAPRAA